LDFSIISTFKQQFLAVLPSVPVSPDALMIHIRGGDIWTRKLIHRKYGQPPLHFFTDAISMGNWSRVEVISEDMNHRAIPELIKRGVEFQTRDLAGDIGRLLNARNLVISRGTFDISIILLSRSLVNLYTFNYSYPSLGAHWNCIPTDEYYREIVNRWRNRWKDQAMIMNSGCVRWEWIAGDGPRLPKARPIADMINRSSGTVDISNFCP
jgi:hypothetical protein